MFLSGHPKARRIDSNKQPDLQQKGHPAGFTHSSAVTVPHRGALVLHLETVGHGPPQHSHQKAEKLRAAQTPAVGQRGNITPVALITVMMVPRQDREGQEAPTQQWAQSSNGQRAATQPGTASTQVMCVDTGSVLGAIQVQSASNASITPNANTVQILSILGSPLELHCVFGWGWPEPSSATAAALSSGGEHQ